MSTIHLPQPFAIPAKAGIHHSADSSADKWAPVFAGTAIHEAGR